MDITFRPRISRSEPEVPRTAGASAPTLAVLDQSGFFRKRVGVRIQAAPAFLKSFAKFASGLLVAGFGVQECEAQTSLTGGGATFPYPIYSKWFAEYQKLHPDIEIEYNPIGSGAGIREITAGAFDFGASDAPMEFSQIKEYHAKRGFDILHFPTVLGADVPIYNIPGVTAELKFTPEALAGIFLGKITKWNDPDLTSTNPDAKLPDREIMVAYRSDGSGTTYIWTNYLAKVSEDWDKDIGFGTAVQWPVGVGGQGNSGVAAIVKQTPYSIGYVELAYAIQNKLAYGWVKNQAGNFVKADLESVTAAAASVAKKMPDDFRVSITNAPGEKAYPISSFTWLLVPAKFGDNNKVKAMKDFLQWMSTDGQRLTTDLQYAPLPDEVVAKEQAAFAKIQ
jgi:phosphate transport system substrate-binding protein